MKDTLIRVLHVVGGMNQGGAENFLMNVYRNIDREKVQFDFLVNREGVFDEEIKALGGKIYYIPALQKVGQIKYTKNLDKFFQEHKEYRIVHSHINQVSGLILERANKAGIPARIAHIHGNKYGKNFVISTYKKYLKSKLKNNTNYKFACSKQAGEFLFGKNSKFEVINNSIEVQKFVYNEAIRKEVRKKLNINDNCYVIGNVARFHPVKNQIFLLKIFDEFIKINPESKLLLIGKGKLKDKIIAYIKEKGLKDKVIMLENRKDVNELMQAMDFFVFPSKAEGLGIVLIEAQAAGLKCLASKDVIPKEVKITELLEFYSLKKDEKDWAKEVYNNRKYERKDMSKQIKSKRYDIKETAKKLEEFYIVCFNKTKKDDSIG